MEITRILEPQLTLEEQYDLYRCARAIGAGEAVWPKTPAVADLLQRFRTRLFYETIGEYPAALGDAAECLRDLADDADAQLLADELPGYLLRQPAVVTSILRTRSVR